MSAFSKLVLAILVGSTWGLLEVAVWDLWHFQNWPYVEALLAVIAVFCMAAARRSIDFPGTTLAIAGVACLIKFTSVAYYPCQMTGVLTLAVSFDVLASLSRLSPLRESRFRPILLGVLTVYPAFFAFALLSVYVLKQSNWAEAGWTRIIEYLQWGAIMATFGGAIAGHAGWRFGGNLVHFVSIGRRLVAPSIVLLWLIAVLHAMVI